MTEHIEMQSFVFIHDHVSKHGRRAGGVMGSTLCGGLRSAAGDDVYLGSGWYLIDDPLVKARLEGCSYCNFDPIHTGGYFDFVFHGEIPGPAEGLVYARSFLGACSNYSGGQFDGHISCIADLVRLEHVVDKAYALEDGLLGPPEVLFVFGLSRVLEEYMTDVIALRDFSRTNFSRAWVYMEEDYDAQSNVAWDDSVDNDGESGDGESGDGESGEDSEDSDTDVSVDVSTLNRVPLIKLADLVKSSNVDLDDRMSSFLTNCFIFIRKWGAVPFPDDLQRQILLAEMNKKFFPSAFNSMDRGGINLDFRTDDRGDLRTGIGGGLTAALRLSPEFYKSSGLEELDRCMAEMTVSDSDGGKIFELGVPKARLNGFSPIWDLDCFEHTALANTWRQPNVRYVDYHRASDDSGDILEVVGTRPVIEEYCRDLYQLRRLLNSAFQDVSSVLSDLIGALQRDLTAFVTRWGNPIPDDIRYMLRQLALKFPEELGHFEFDSNFNVYTDLGPTFRKALDPRALFRVTRVERNQDRK